MRGPSAVGRRGATFAVVAVSSQFVVKYVCRVSGLARVCPIAVKNAALFDIQSGVCVLLLDSFASRSDSTRIR